MATDIAFLGLVPALRRWIIFPLDSKEVSEPALTALEGVGVEEGMHLLRQVDDLHLILIRILGMTLEPGVLDVLLKPFGPQGGQYGEEEEPVYFS